MGGLIRNDHFRVFISDLDVDPPRGPCAQITREAASKAPWNFWRRRPGFEPLLQDRPITIREILFDLRRIARYWAVRKSRVLAQGVMEMRDLSLIRWSDSSPARQIG